MLDVRTIVIQAMIFNLLIGLTQLFYVYKKRDIKGLTNFVASFISMALGFFVMAFRDYFNVFTTVIIANALLMLGIVLAMQGIVKFKDKSKNTFFLDYSLYLAYILFYLVFTYIYESVNARIIVFSAVQIYFYTRIIYYLHEKSEPFIRVESYVTSVYFIVSVALTLYRVYATLRGAAIMKFMDAGFIHAVTLIVLSIMPFTLTLGIFWISSNKYKNELMTRSMTDFLTGLYNREAIVHLGESEFARQRRKHGAIGIIMGDIDFFKRINDSFGHEVGDDVLISIAKVLKLNVRSSDLVSRYGGEEFLIIIPEIEKNCILDIIEKIRAEIEHNKVHSNESIISVTMSFGVSMVLEQDIDLKEAIRRADDALYQAKESGRNMVCFK